MPRILSGFPHPSWAKTGHHIPDMASSSPGRVNGSNIAPWFAGCTLPHLWYKETTLFCHPHLQSHTLIWNNKASLKAAEHPPLISADFIFYWHCHRLDDIDRCSKSMSSNFSPPWDKWAGIAENVISHCIPLKPGHSVRSLFKFPFPLAASKLPAAATPTPFFGALFIR